MNHLAESAAEKELIIKKRADKSGGGQWGSNDMQRRETGAPDKNGELNIRRSVLRMEYQEGSGSSGGEKEATGEEQPVKVRREVVVPVDEYLGIERVK